jgi:hypothetical protein
MKKILLTGVCAAFFGLGFSQVNVAFFNFNSTTDDATVATGSDQAAQGTASITTIGGVTQAYATGNPNDINTTDNSGYQTTNYPAQDTDPKTAGIEMTVNTTGFSALQFECRNTFKL